MSDIADEELLASFRSRWHRLYLDTAELNELAGGRVDAGLVRDLHAACRDRRTVLVISREHLRDAFRPGDGERRPQFAAMLEQFPTCAMVTTDPYEIEPWQGDVKDIVISPCGNIREVLTSEHADAALEREARVQDATHAGDRDAIASMRGSARVQIPRRLHDVIAGVTIFLVGGTMGEELDPIIDRCASLLDAHVSDADRALIKETVRPMLDMLRHLAPLMAEGAIDRIEVTRQIGVGPGDSPGRWLAQKLVSNRLRNVGRNPQRSDVVDLFHATYYPYMDVATCDRQAHDALLPFLDEVRGSRASRGQLVRNGQLATVVECLEQLPEL
jgi:hypothetical protein